MALLRPDGIVWLASYPRSGNTWTRMFLSNLVSVLEGKGPHASVDESRFGLSDTVAELYEQVLDRPLEELSPDEIVQTRPKMLRRLIEGADGFVPLKTHFANIGISGVPVVDPGVTAGAIYLVRNPLDVAISYAAFRNIDIDRMITDLGTSGIGMVSSSRRIASLVGSWSEHVRTWTIAQHPALLVVRYEDLLDQPEATFGLIAAHVGMTCTPEELAEAINRSSFKRLQTLETETGFSEKPDSAEQFFRVGKSGQWRDVLTPAQVERVINDHGEQMTRFGYLPS